MEATQIYKPEVIILVTDTGIKDINSHVDSFLKNLVCLSKFIITQRDVLLSNSMIEAVNKILKQ